MQAPEINRASLAAAIAAQQIEQRITNAKIPPRYADAEPPEIKELPGWTERGTRVLVLAGANGVGKTHTACALLRAWIQAGRGRGQFTTASRLIASIQDGYSKGTASRTIDHWAGISLAVIDDLGAEKHSEDALEKILMVVDERVNSLLPTIVTTNVTGAGLVETYSGRMFSRLAGGTVVRMGGPDRRKGGE